MKALLCLILPFALIVASFAPAQDADAEDNEADGLRGFWQARMAMGHYMVKLGAISSVGKHEYQANGARVVEVSVATNTSVVARFYFLEASALNNSPLQGTANALSKLQDKLEEGITRAGGDPAGVVKHYPDTTHAHTIEFRVLEETHLESLYRSLLRALTYGKGRIWSEPTGE